jgi:hypothetical protein
MHAIKEKMLAKPNAGAFVLLQKLRESTGPLPAVRVSRHV